MGVRSMETNEGRNCVQSAKELFGASVEVPNTDSGEMVGNPQIEVNFGQAAPVWQ